jgi:hypothetical protein
VNLNASGVESLTPSIEWGNLICSGVLNMANCKNVNALSGCCGSDVNLTGSAISTLGKDFECGGSLYVDKCASLISLDCRVGGNLYAEHSGLKKLGSDFKCDGDWRLCHCSSLSELDKTSSTPRDVFLTKSGVRKIASVFQCSGALILRDVGSLEKMSGRADCADIEGAPLLEEIRDLRVAADLSVADCPRLEFVDFLAGATAKFDSCWMREICDRSSSRELIIRACKEFEQLSGLHWGEVSLIDLPKMKAVSPHFRCSGSLLVRSCPNLKELDGRVGQNLTLSLVESLPELPDTLTVGQNLVLACPELNLKSISCRVMGDMLVLGCQNYLATSPSMRVEGNIAIDNCEGLRELRGWVGGNVTIRNGCGLKNIGADFECEGDMLMEECRSLRSLNCRVGGDVGLRRSCLEKTGPAFCCRGSLILEAVDGVKMLCGSVGSLPPRFDLGGMIRSGIVVKLAKEPDCPPETAKEACFRGKKIQTQVLNKTSSQHRQI